MIREPQFSETQFAQGYMLKWRAGELAGLYQPQKRGALTIPPEWITYLLLDKAGMPRDLIAHFYEIERRRLNKLIRATKALMLFAPFAARIERLMRAMPHFNVPDAAEPPARLEALCAEQG